MIWILTSNNCIFDCWKLFIYFQNKWVHFENKLKHLESEVSEYHAVVGELKSAVRELLPKKEGHPNNPFKTSKNDILKGLQDPKKSAEFAEDDQMKCSLQMDSVPHSNIQVIYIK